jgi:hypothetical protein
VGATFLITDGILKPRGETNVGSAGGCASLTAWARTTSPIVLSCVDAAGARGVIEGANVGDTSIATQQVVEMSIELGRSIDGNVLVFINDHILRNDGTANRGAATAAIDVDSGGPVRGRVVRVGAVSGDEVANDYSGPRNLDHPIS